ncbi:MAG: transposase, partial [Chlorobium sp.]|nr:transposase [Chlorobium sp.]
MTRPLRIEFPGALYHVTSRGDRREDIFFDEADRLLWLELFGLVCLRHNWVCHAWCQMSNHYHVVVETMEGNLSRGMRQLNGVYTQTFNRNHQRVGHVFQGRYRSIIVEKDTYLLELIRYVVLNPVRAGMVNNAADWPWSSYGAVVGTAGRPEWLQTDLILAHFGRSRGKAITGFVDFVRAGVDQPGLWQSLRGQVYLGSKAFIEQVQQRGADQSTVLEIPRIQRRPLARPLAEYRETIVDTQEAMATAYATGDYTMQEIATCF